MRNKSGGTPGNSGSWARDTSGLQDSPCPTCKKQWWGEKRRSLWSGGGRVDRPVAREGGLESGSAPPRWPVLAAMHPRRERRRSARRPAGSGSAARESLDHDGVPSPARGGRFPGHLARRGGRAHLPGILPRALPSRVRPRNAPPPGGVVADLGHVINVLTTLSYARGLVDYVLVRAAKLRAASIGDASSASSAAASRRSRVSNPSVNRP